MTLANKMLFKMNIKVLNGGLDVSSLMRGTTKNDRTSLEILKFVIVCTRTGKNVS